MIWVPADTDIVTLHASGTGDMGDVTNKNSTARFSLKDAIKKGFCLVSAKIHYAGGSGAAVAQMLADHAKGKNFDIVEAESANPVGSSEPTWAWLVPPEEYPHFSWSQDTELVFVWTDPDGSKATEWGIEIKLAPYAYNESL